ncbi:hypothetical protein DND132_0873 [Pseudodesulfovibrio mercurii]|uniref:Outer membrane lipoprotein-sorting protein n=1 Tax=Pseudodesulfovibrio mercurii TaxID=641491 RepID=F0JHV8_9BACT|nr:hypothetical protein [Pseudodesulfovibrio mercurii]EGB14088.1 hypothetical protein DND132_0873 [Pseudodesulfovibrio mercurii]
MKTLLTLLLLCLTALPAHAFVPDGEELAARLQKHYGPMRSWQATMTFPDHPGVAVDLWYAGGRWRQEWRADGKAVAVGSLGNVVGACTPGPFPLSPLFVWMVPHPVKAWQAWGVDVTAGDYGFCGEDPCLMLGANPADAARPTVYLNNEDLAPLLVRYSSAAGMISVEFADYRTFAGYRVPGRVTVRTDRGELAADVQWVRLNNAGGEELYAREGLDPAPCVEPAEPFGFLRDAFRYPGTK